MVVHSKYKPCVTKGGQQLIPNYLFAVLQAAEIRPMPGVADHLTQPTIEQLKIGGGRPCNLENINLKDYLINEPGDCY